MLVHGAGHTSTIWAQVRRRLQSPSLAVDLPGRDGCPADITAVRIDDAAGVVAAAVEASVPGDVVLVGHSAGGIVLPAVAARLGPRVRHLVFVAGLIARHGERVAETVLPDRIEAMEARVADVRREWSGRVFVRRGRPTDPLPDGLSVLADAQLAQSIDSINYMFQTVSWSGVPDVPRTWIRCLRDALQPRPLQDRLIANAGATEVLEIDADHTPAVSRPAELAALLDGIVGRYGALPVPGNDRRFT